MKSAQPNLRRKKKATDTKVVMILIGFLIGSVTGYLFGTRVHQQPFSSKTSSKVLIEQINPPEGYALPARFGNIGPLVVDAGAIDSERFIDYYAKSGRPLNPRQLSLLKNGSDDQIVINQDNAAFLLNLFWALGLVNENRILTEGLMMNYGMEGVVNFASTGGWTLGSKPIAEIYASTPIISLSDDEQSLLAEVAAQVFRPCCNNPTFFPDCNHGMAMLGMLELMISQGATEEELFEAAKYVNAFWFLPQTIEVATYFYEIENVSFNQLDSREAVGREYASASGFQEVHQWLADNNALPQAPGGENNCGI